MENNALDVISNMTDSIAQEDWKKAIDDLVHSLRKIVVFDNLVVYLSEKKENPPEAVYARSLGRGRQAEADAAWGETITNQVLATGEIVKSNPQIAFDGDRVLSPYVLGLPLNMLQSRGVLILVRFGGPDYTTGQLNLVKLFAANLTYIFERRSFRENLVQFESVKLLTQLQDDFIATISHDFNTPLGFIKGYATSLLRSDISWDPETTLEFLTIIDEETDQLINLVGQLLDSARLKNGKLLMDFQPVRLDSMVRDLITRLTSRKKEIVIKLTSDQIPPIQADSNRLVQVFENLIDNANKYAPGASISIAIHNRIDHLVLDVSDDGPGIPEQHLPFLFERFYRVPGQSEKRGTGLGLFICKEIVNAHHGSISVESSIGQGTIFHIELPVLQPGNYSQVGEN
ncbi:MAG: HAMP domain-containing sensor histidine kinase [Chloroflexota bacterium]